MQEVEIAVIGAGLTGLTTAHHLNKAGKSFRVLEKSERCGGVINTQKENGFVYEQGPNTGVLGTPEVAELFEDLKDLCEIEIASDNVEKRYVLKNGKWNALPMSLISAVKTPLFTFGDKLRVLGEPFRSKGKKPHETLADMVKRRLGKSFLNYAIDPFILGVYAGDPNLLIPKYALPKLYNLEQTYGSFIGGAIRKKFEKKTERDKKATRKVFSAKGGFSSFTNAIYKSAGTENFIFEAENIKIELQEGSYIISFLKDNETHYLKAKKVITTTGAYALEKMLPFIDKADFQNINSLYYAKVVEIILGFNQWTGMTLDGFGGLIPHKEKRDILGILFMSSLLKNRAPTGGAALTIFMGGVRRQDIVNLPDADIKKMVEREIMDLMALKDFKPDLFKIVKHKKAIPQYYVDSGKRFETIDKLQKQFPGLFLGGNIRDGIGMADRIKQGKMLAETVISDE